jgi:DNA repair exonuclease SbcCD nuclease subunit
VPYRLNGTCVEKENNDGEWVTEKCHDTRDEARAHLAALEINVEDADMSDSKKKYRRDGDTVKAVQDDNPLRVSGYLVRFTDDSDRDLHNEYFSKDTEFFLETGYPIKGDRILIEHGFDDAFRAMPVGIFEMASVDDVGLWVEGKLHDRSEYEEMLRRLQRNGKAAGLSDDDIRQKAEIAELAVRSILETGNVQWSSGALPQTVEVSEDGHIKTWAIIEGTMTFTPAEPDGTEVAPVKSALKQLSEILNTQLSIQPDKRTTAAKEASESEESDVQSVVERGDGQTHANTITNDNPMRFTKMDMDKLQSIIDNHIDSLMAEIANEMNEDEKEMDYDDDDKAAVEEEIETRMDDMDEDEQKSVTSEQVLQWLAESTVKRFADKQEAARKAQQDAAQQALSSWKANQPAKSKATAYTGGNQKDNGLRIEVRSPYADWTAEDMSFAASMAQNSRIAGKPIRFNPDQKFFRELADKAAKGYQSGSLRLPNDAIKSINAIKADELDYSTQTGFGDEWVPTIWSDNIWDKPRLDNVVVPLLNQVEMPGNPYEYPVETTDPTLYFVNETEDEADLTLSGSGNPIPDSKIGTDKVTFNAKKFALRVGISAELEEDSIRRLMPKFREQAQRAVQDGLDNVALNGDTSTSGNINLDGGTPGSNAKYLAYDGLIHQALVSASSNAVDASGSAPTLAGIRNLRSSLGNAEGYNPENLAIITDFPTYMKLLSMDEVLTVDKYGSNATVVDGELARVDGIRIFVSNEMALADTDGKITDGGNTTDRGRLLLMHRPSWYLGYRRRINQSLTFIPFYDSYQLVMTVRSVLVGRTYSDSTQQSTDDTVSLLYNIAV